MKKGRHRAKAPVKKKNQLCTSASFREFYRIDRIFKIIELGTLEI